MRDEDFEQLMAEFNPDEEEHDETWYNPEEDLAAREADSAEEKKEPVPVALGQPAQPTKEEKESHDLTHSSFAPWCSFCVKATA